jgi:hypothetical protein
VLAAAVLALGGQSVWWAFALLVAMPRLGDAAMAWRHAYRGRRLVACVRRWSHTEQTMLRDAVQRVRDAWHTSHASHA